MITRDLLLEVLLRPGDDGQPRLEKAAADHVVESCLGLFEAEADAIRREILRTAAERISPTVGAQVFAGAPWDMGFHDGKSVAADALRLMARQL
ncbi:MAG: hypothetical protein M9891_18135 [Austwickia sp.]|nr:hypothetical protein [Actinomycetota bacterium]MCO5311165.1 hypothetical protein [Austwickia sp.]